MCDCQSTENVELEVRFREKIECRNESFTALQTYLNEARLFPKEIDKIIVSALYGDVGEINPHTAYLLRYGTHGSLYTTVWYSGCDQMFIMHAHRFQWSMNGLTFTENVWYKYFLNIDEFWQFLLDGDADRIIKMCCDYWVSNDSKYPKDPTNNFTDDLRNGLLKARNEILYPSPIDWSLDESDDDAYISD